MSTDPVFTTLAVKLLQSKSVAVGPADEMEMEELIRSTWRPCITENSLACVFQDSKRELKVKAESTKNMVNTMAAGIGTVMVDV